MVETKEGLATRAPWMRAPAGGMVDDAGMNGSEKRSGQRRGAATRSAILSAAAREFARKGFEGGSMRSIARDLGVEIAHIQHHFRDKATLWSAVLADVIGGQKRSFEAILSDHADRPAAEIIARQLVSLIHYAARNETFVALLSHARTSPTEHANAYLHELSDISKAWIELIARAQADGTFVAGDPGLLFYNMVGAALRIFGTAVDASATLGRRLDDLVDEHVRLCTSLFLRPDGAAAAAAPPRSYDSAFLAQSPQPSVFFLLSQIASAMRSDFDAHLGKIGITVAHMEALLAISKELNLSSADIARRLGVTAQSAGQAVQALEDQKLVRRSPARRNRRVLEISVTPKGYDVLELLARIVGSAEERLLTSIDAEDRLMLKAMLLRILREQRPAVLENWRPLLSSR